MERWSSRMLGVAAVLIGVAAWLAGCGSSSSSGGGGSCGKVQPCGGSVLGTWAISSSCDSVSNFTAGRECAGATLDESQMSTSGTFTFNADMTVSATVSVSGTIRFSVPLNCEPPGLTTCDELTGVISPGPPDANTTCTTMGTTCSCAIVYAGPMTGNVSGTYGTAGDVLTITDSTGVSDSQSYCVQGNTLHLLDVDPATGAITHDIIATK